MTETIYDYHGEVAWCTGCGDYRILDALKLALQELGIAPRDLAAVSGIGQAAKMPHYFICNCVNGLHGRALPLATGVKAANKNLTVIAIGGDGDMYGEGGNHFIHTIRRNPDITNIVCNNMIYGLTKGQGSPTTELGTKTTTQPFGVTNQPLNPLMLALACGATFVARSAASDYKKTQEIIKEAITHKGYALVDIFQPCVSFNKKNTWQWLQASTKWLGEEHDATDFSAAFKLTMANDPYPLGIFYQVKGRPTFDESQPLYQQGDDSALWERDPNLTFVEETLKKL